MSNGEIIFLFIIGFVIGRYVIGPLVFGNWRKK